MQDGGSVPMLLRFLMTASSGWAMIGLAGVTDTCVHVSRQQTAVCTVTTEPPIHNNQPTKCTKLFLRYLTL